MKPFRRHAVLSIDGGGIRGTMVAEALAILEQKMGQPCADLFRIYAGTSTGSILSTCLAARIPARRIHELYVELGTSIFKRTWRFYWPLSGWKFSTKPLASALRDVLGERTMGSFWEGPQPIDVITTVRDLAENRTLYVKSWKPEYREWKAWYAVLCSCAVPTYFPVVDGRYVDGGVGSYTNPCYLAAYEAAYLANWDPRETTLISLGTGRPEGRLKQHLADRFNALAWVRPLIDSFLADASDQQVRVVRQFFPDLDFRRFQIELDPPVALDDPASMPVLTELGKKLADKIWQDEVDERVLRRPGKMA
jgi:predicted acylesterase/phospholipase RssA